MKDKKYIENKCRNCINFSPIKNLSLGTCKIKDVPVDSADGCIHHELPQNYKR